MDAARTVLIVDDDPDIVAAERLLLEIGGYRVLDASNGKECLKVVRTEPVDLILLDVMMDTEDEGFQVTQQLKSDPKTSEIPILMVSSISRATGFDYADKSFMQVEDFIEKPVQPRVLLQKVEEVFKRVSK